MKRPLSVCVALLLGTVSFAQYYGSEKSIQEIGEGRRAYPAPDSGIGVDQKLKDVVPLDLWFTDSDGQKVQLRDLFTGRPVILMPIFYECGGVCALELNGMVATLKDFTKDFVGEHFDLITFTIKPTETVEQAAQKKGELLDVYNHRGAEDGWHFLVGEQKEIAALTEAIGFRYEYDPKTGAVIHPAAAVVLTPTGQISQYFLETSYMPSALLDAIQTANKGSIGRKVDNETFWNCVEIDPLTGQRSLNVLKFLRLTALVTLIAVAGAIVFMTRKYKNSSVEVKEGGSAGA